MLFLRINNEAMDIRNDFSERFRQRLESLTEEDVIVFDQIGHWNTGVDFRTYGHGAILCLEGKATCRLGDSTLEIRKNDISFCFPNQFVENAMLSLDFKCKGLLMTPKYFESIFLLMPYVWDNKGLIFDNPILHLDDTQVKSLVDDFNFLRGKLSASSMPHHKEMIKLLLQSLIYDFFDCISPKIDLSSHVYSASEAVFRRFMNLVAENTPQHRNVSFYADKLCLTPKYLSAICKQESGKTAFEITNSFAIEHIKRMLRTTEKSVKEIAHESGFPNVSFFGKYVRREMGISPKEYRLRQREPSE